MMLAVCKRKELLNAINLRSHFLVRRFFYAAGTWNIYSSVHKVLKQGWFEAFVAIGRL